MKQKKTKLVSMADLSKEDLNDVLDIAKKIKSNPFSKKVLKNKSVALIFAKPSLRTRVSFEVGVNQLGGQPITIKMDEISIGARENVEDIANVLSRYVSAIVIRTFEQNQIEKLSEFSNIPVINALSNDEHPCQIAADLFTIKETFNKLSGLKIAYIGDGNNVAQSLIIGGALSNTNISIGCPNTHKPNDFYVKLARKINPKVNIEVLKDPFEAARNADVLYTDVWTSMGQEKEYEKRKRIFSNYQINDKLLKVAKKSAIVLHCLPAHKGMEITSKVFDRFSEVIYRQAENRLHAQKAILIKLLEG